MSEVNSRKKSSLISVIILFLSIILITILLIKKIDSNYIVVESDPLLNINSTEYFDRKKEDVNSYITALKEIYGINVIYGKDTLNYSLKVNATVLEDLNIINNNIKILFNALEKYPKSMFDIFKGKEYKLDVILLDKFNDNNLALASKNNLNELKLYVSNTDNFERALHHEFFHIFEYYITDKNKDVFKDWKNFNPDGFKYESNISKLDSTYVYEKNNIKTNEDCYFVTKYAKTSDKEDRAETFAQIMMLTSIPDYLKEDENIRKKADNILINMSKFLNIKNIYCSKFLK